MNMGEFMAKEKTVLGDQPTCKKCGCLYPVEYSKHEDYCDECFKEIQASK